jgi:hypothetical protein
MRLRWGRFGYSLGGEVDKCVHPLFRGGPYKLSKPDFLIHMPGDMDRNLAVVEVKAATASLEDLFADVEKLVWFCSEAAYFGGILLVCGDVSRFDGLLPELCANVSALNAPHIAVLCHFRPGTRPELAVIVRAR